MSTNCPKPDFIADGHFLRLPVNDSHGEKLLPYFNRATQFIGEWRRVLSPCRAFLMPPVPLSVLPQTR